LNVGLVFSFNSRAAGAIARGWLFPVLARINRF